MDPPFSVVLRGEFPLGESDFDREAYVAQLVGENALLRSQVGELEEALRRDPLTGLYNQTGFDERLDELLMEGVLHQLPLSVAFFDINNFKRFNDRYGHACGDQVLKTVAAYVQRELHGEGVAARLHGDEFALALPAVPEDIAEGYCEHLLKGIAQLAVPYREQFLGVTATFGVKQWRGENRSELVGAANEYFRLGQDAGKNCVVSERLYRELRQ